jgi:hypothetical protein
VVDLSENSVWIPVTRIETTDVALGGNETSQPNLSNKQLVDRTRFLLDQITQLQSALAAQTNGGRLTISSTNPTPLFNRQNSKIIYWLPYTSNQISLWDGAQWVIREIPVGGLQLDTSGWPTPQTRDIFAYWDDVADNIALATRIWGDPNLIANRGYNIENFQGVDVLESDRTRRYLGCAYNSAQSTLATPGIHDDYNIVDIWNRDNQRVKSLAFSLDSPVETVSHTTARIAKGLLTESFFRLISGDPTQTFDVDALGQLINLTTVDNAFLALEFGGFNDRQSVATAARLFTGSMQLTAAINCGAVPSKGSFLNRGVQCIYLQDYRTSSGANPQLQYLRSSMSCRY